MRWVGWGLGVLIVGRVLVEVARIGTTSTENSGLALTMALNTAIVLAGCVLLYFIFGALFSSRARARRRALLAAWGDGLYVEVSKDPRLVRGLRLLLPEAPDEFWRGGFLGTGYLTTCRVTDQGIEFWWGGRVPELAGSIGWAHVRRVTVGSEVRGARRDPSVEVWVSVPDGEVALPLIVHEERRAGFEAVGQARAAEVADQLNGMHRAARETLSSDDAQAE